MFISISGNETNYQIELTSLQVHQYHFHNSYLHNFFFYERDDRNVTNQHTQTRLINFTAVHFI